MSRTDWRFWSALFAATIFLSYSAAATPCDIRKTPRLSIIACTQGINSGKWKGRDLAAYYSNRAGRLPRQGRQRPRHRRLHEAIRLDPKFAMAYNNRGIAYSEQGRQRPRHRRLQRGDPARSEIRHGLQQPRYRLQRQGRQRPRHRRLQRGDPARSEIRHGLQQPRHAPIATRATTTAPSPTTTRRSGSIPKIAEAYNNRGHRLRRQGRLRPRHRRLQRGDPARSERRHGLQSTAAVAYLDKGDHRPRHRRLQRGDPARSRRCRRLQQSRCRLSRQGRPRPRHRRLQ